MRIHAMLVVASLWPLAAAAVTQHDAVTAAFAEPSTKQPSHVHKPLFKLKFVLRRGPGKLYDLSAFDPDTAVPAITAPPDLRRDTGRAVLLAPAAASPNVIVCFGRECETPQH